MKSNMRMLLFVLSASGATAEAQTPPPNVEVLDSVCVEAHAARCFEVALPVQRPYTGGPSGNSCLPGYTNGIFLQPPQKYYGCVRQGINSPEAAQTFLPVLQACEVDARVHFANECSRPVQLNELMSTLRVDMRQLLAEFCKTYTDKASQAQCDALKSPAAPAAAGK